MYPLVDFGLIVDLSDRYLRKLSLLNWSQSLVVNGNQPPQFIISDILRKLGFTDRTMQVINPDY